MHHFFSVSLIKENNHSVFFQQAARALKGIQMLGIMGIIFIDCIEIGCSNFSAIACRKIPARAKHAVNEPKRSGTTL